MRKKNIVDYEDEIKKDADHLIEKCRDLGWPAMFITGMFGDGEETVDQMVMLTSAIDEWMPTPLAEIYAVIANEGILHWLVDNIEMLSVIGKESTPDEPFMDGVIDISPDEVSAVINGGSELEDDDSLFGRMAKIVVKLRSIQ